LILEIEKKYSMSHVCKAEEYVKEKRKEKRKGKENKGDNMALNVIKF
jgi:hypothetical protein